MKAKKEMNEYMLLNVCDIYLTLNIGETKYMELGHHGGIIENEHMGRY